MSGFVLDASYTLTWCFQDRCTPHTEATLSRLEAGIDYALVPWVWQVEIGNALGKAVTKNKLGLPRALEIWDELSLLPIQQIAIGKIPQLLHIAVTHNLSMYDTCYLHLALVYNLPIATNDNKMIQAAEASGLALLIL